MRKADRLPAVLTVLTLLLGRCAPQPPSSDEKNQATTATVAGGDLSRLDAAFALARKYGSGSLIVMTNGETVRTMGDLRTPHRVHSVRKALLNALIGQQMVGFQFTKPPVLVQRLGKKRIGPLHQAVGFQLPTG